MAQAGSDPYCALKKLILATPLGILTPPFVIDQARAFYGFYDSCARADLREMAESLAKSSGETDGSRKGEIVQLAVEMGV
jgi:hypothetical protein